MSAEVGAEITWDFALVESEESKLVEKAAKLTLTEHEEAKLIEALKSSPDAALEWGLSKEMLPGIINNYGKLAYYIYTSLNDHPFIEQ